MISKIIVRNQATYSAAAPAITDLKSINYFYGANGSGKTTISRVIANVSAHPQCSLSWIGNTPLECFVYNRDFREKHFDESTPLKGVFTLGDQNVQLQKDIGEKLKAVEEKTKAIQGLTVMLEGDEDKTGKQSELDVLGEEFAVACWKQKTTHEGKFKAAFAGVSGSKQKFRDKLLYEYVNNKAAAISLDQMGTKAETVFGEAPSLEVEFPELDCKSLSDSADDPILRKAVVGSADVAIADLIKTLGNGDWVNKGLSFFKTSGPKCPFCQQETSTDLAKQFERFFDGTYAKDRAEIVTLLAKYEREEELLRVAMDQLVKSQSPRLDLETLRAYQKQVLAELSENLGHLRSKNAAPSTKVTLKPIASGCDDINAMLRTANAAIKSHNAMVKNLSSEKSSLIGQVWRYLLDVELKAEFDAYRAKKEGIERPSRN